MLPSANRRKILILTKLSKSSIPCLTLPNVSKIGGITDILGQLICRWELYSYFFPATCGNQIFKTSNQEMHAILKSRSPIAIFFLFFPSNIENYLTT